MPETVAGAVVVAAAAQYQFQRCSLLAISISKFVDQILVPIASVLIVFTKSFGSIIDYLY